jgi:hypothetical protein
MKFQYSQAIYFVAFNFLFTWVSAAFSQNETVESPKQLAPFGNVAASALNPAWKITGLPDNKAPLSQFEWRTADGQAALALRTAASYGVLRHVWRGSAPAELAWNWRLDQPVAQADIQTKGGDDAALKVCVMFEQPMTDIPFLQRAALGIARTATGEYLPSATLCYLWDVRYPAGTRGPNPYSGRVRYIVVSGSEARLGQWVSQRRRVAEDFALMFGQETKTLPAITAVAVGADSDNTKGSSLGYLADLRWLP